MSLHPSPSSSGPQARPPPWLRAVACAVGAAALLLLARWLSGRGDVAAGLLLALALGAVGGGWFGHRARRGNGRPAHDATVGAQQELAALTRWLPLWHWRCDGDLALSEWRAPGQPPGPAPFEPPWRSDAALRQWLADGRPLDVDLRLPTGVDIQSAVPPWQAGALDDGRCRRWHFRGEPLHDATGRCIGHAGIAWPLPEPAEPAGTGLAQARADAEAHAAFAYTISHDLRAPLRVIEGFGRFLKEDHGEALGRLGNDHLDRILGASARMNQMIDSLLALTRLSSQRLESRTVDLSALAAEVIDELRRTQPGRQVRVDVEPGLVARGDPALLRMVLENLLGNAWKYTGKTAEPSIRLHRAELDGRPGFAVEDNGAGFDMKVAGKLFGAFQRLHSASDFAGTGVGLASVRRIVRRHGGDIRARAEPGRGACFTFTLDPAGPPDSGG